ncbi:hypothetical protein [Paracoccus spongiarum]|uniref:Uncharacterized protein n=1 Tax=Paracoccus spongiarum TaxID=3064387 RepID=A0ABT9JEL5_9RHOB|nr:hypothetical protein [Paracoccus sp. 2205BS29-5]MDP5307501.1 hypothetical protein [Paracoccus sp. 2205BS29-5]
MARLGHLLQIASAAGFLASGALFAITRPDDPRLASPMPALDALTTGLPLPRIEGPFLPHLFLNPQNIVMWALLMSIWVAVATDALGQLTDPSEGAGRRRLAAVVRLRVWPMLVPALLLAALWPWLLEPAPRIAGVMAVAAALLAFLAAWRGVAQRRPALGFLAGWSVGLASATLAAQIAAPAGMSLAQMATLAILPAAGSGVAAQILLGRGIGVSVALIWAFCGLAMTTMGVSPMTAIAAILAIVVMAAVLVSAAS